MISIYKWIVMKCKRTVEQFPRCADENNVIKAAAGVLRQELIHCSFFPIVRWHLEKFWGCTQRLTFNSARWNRHLHSVWKKREGVERTLKPKWRRDTFPQILLHIKPQKEGTRNSALALFVKANKLIFDRHTWTLLHKANLLGRLIKINQP